MLIGIADLSQRRNRAFPILSFKPPAATSIAAGGFFLRFSLQKWYNLL